MSETGEEPAATIEEQAGGKLENPALVREAADELLNLGGFLLLTDKGAGLLTDLAWIKSKAFAPEDLSWDIREKQRHRVTEPERCTLCRVKLVWPAQIVWRRGLEIVAISAPIGIQCATREAARKGWGKLHDLITEVRAIRGASDPPSSPNPSVTQARTTPNAPIATNHHDSVVPLNIDHLPIAAASPA